MTGRCSGWSAATTITSGPSSRCTPPTPIRRGLTTPYQGTCAFTNNVCQPGTGRRFDDRPVTHIRDQAVFGQVDWNFTSAWKATVGLRYSENRKDGEEAVRIFCYAVNTCYAAPELKPFLPGGVVPLVDLTQIPSVVSNPAIAAGGNGVYGKGVGPTTYDPATGFAHRNYGASWSATTGTAGLQYEPDRNTLAYLRYSRGFKAGGFRVGIDTVLAPNPYTEAEQVDDIELGIKKTIRAVRVRPRGLPLRLQERPDPAQHRQHVGRPRLLAVGVLQYSEGGFSRCRT